MTQALKEFSKNWSLPFLWLLVAMKQYYMTWEVAQLYCGGLLIVFCLSYIFFHLNSLVNDSVSKLVLVYLLFILVFASGMCMAGSGTLQGLIDILIFPVFFLFFYAKATLKKISPSSMVFVAIVFLPFAIWNAFRWRGMFDDSGALSAQSNAGNFVVALLPFIFLIRRKVFRWLVFGGIAVAIFISMKRSGIIIWGAFVVYELFFSNHNKAGIIKRLWLITLGLVVLLSGWAYFSDTDVAFRIQKRLSLLSEDGGSGRVDLFFQGIQDWTNSSSLGWLVGNGPVGSSDFLWGLRYAYHNDIAESLRAVGFFGTGIFVSVFVVLIVKAWRYKFQKLQYGDVPFVCMIFFLLSMGMFSPLVGFTFYTMPTIALMGVCFSHCCNQQQARLYVK